MASNMTMELMGEKTLHHTADPCLLAYCPSMELVAVGSSDDQVVIYRLNGQRVYGAVQKGSSLHVERIGWKSNGQLLAIAWSDGIVRLVGAESNKTVHQISTSTDEGVSITCLGWASNFTGKQAMKNTSRKPEMSWKDFITEKADHRSQPDLDLPRDLSLIDIESSMPKLSVLPVGGTADDIFSSRASLDALFRAFDPKDNDVVDILVVGTANGVMHLSIYDSFIIGSFPLPMNSGQLPTHHLTCHASHKQYSTHALLMKSTSSLVGDLYFVPMDLRFVSATNSYLSLLASQSTALQNLLRYIHQVQALMTAEWHATQDLPSKFLRNINETLAEKDDFSIVQAMYHSVVTGHTFPAVREWLVDELAERGHKRWDKAVMGGLENLRKLVHEDMLPALERCSVILSRLYGIAKYQGANENIGFTSQQINVVLDTVACLTLVSNRILAYVVDEIDLFAAFSTWLRHEIDRLASDSSSSPSDDITEIEATIDHSKVLLYIQTAMTTSKLSAFFYDMNGEARRKIESGLPMFEMVDQQLHCHEYDLPYEKSYTTVEPLYEHLAVQANSVFKQIAEAEKRNVLFGAPVAVGTGFKDGATAMKLCYEDDSHFSTYVAVAPDSQTHIIRISCILMRIENGISTRVSTKQTAINFNEAIVKDIAFLGDSDILLLLVSPEQDTFLFRIPYRTSDQVLSYSSGITSNVPTTHNISEITPFCKQYSFPQDASFVPDKLELDSNSAAQIRTARLCVLGKNRLHYKIFTIPDAILEQDIDEDISMS